MNTLTSYLGTMAAYNRWMNESLYGICASIPDELRKKDMGASYTSIHGTLNHLLLADILWLSRFENTPKTFPSLDYVLTEDFDELRLEREKTDAHIDRWAALEGTRPEEELDQPVRFHSMTLGKEVSIQRRISLMHFFNHQTHHRGQLTTLLNQAGYDFGLVDLAWAPGSSS